MLKFTKTIFGALCLTLVTLGNGGYASTGAMQFSAATSAFEPIDDLVYSALETAVWPMSFSSIYVPDHIVLAKTQKLSKTSASISGHTHAMQFFRGTV